VSANSLGKIDPRRPVPTLFNVAGQHGRRTAAFFSSTWGYDGAPPFPRVNGADVYQDHSHRRPCPEEAGSGRLRAASPDRCTFAALEQWIGQSRQPFLAMLWTDDTHYPYRGSDKERTAVRGAGEDAESLKGRFLRSLAVSDRLIGELVDRLRESGQLDDTLLVVVGDHGEAFGQHDNLVHGWDLYEETMRVPLLFINARQFAGARDHHPVRNIDIAPTILARMGIAPPASFQGVDLATGARPRRVFYSAPWAGVVVGYREGERKYVYWLGRDQLLAYDLARDPGERHPRELADSPERSTVLRRLLNWTSVAELRIGAMGADQRR
jgi:hypothetical protein